MSAERTPSRSAIVTPYRGSGGSGGFARAGRYCALMEPVARDKSARAKPQAQPPERLGPIARRIVCALALVPIVPAVSVLGVNFIGHFFGFGAFDEVRCFHLIFSVLWVVTTIAIWRRVIVWTLGRKWLTALVNLIPFVQVVYGQPLWVAPTGGCSNFRLLRDEMLRFGQHEVGIGIWIWLTVWIWWAWEKTHMMDGKVKRRATPLRMTPTAKRLVASIASIPFLLGSFFVVGEALRDFTGLTDPIRETLALSSVLAIAVWMLIWRRVVIWTRTVLLRTAGLAFVLFGLPIGGQFSFLHDDQGFVLVVLLVAPVVGWGVWMIATVTIWPITFSVDALGEWTPRCLRCGYLLTGLRSTRCPECGDEPTLDALWKVTAGTV